MKQQICLFLFGAIFLQLLSLGLAQGTTDVPDKPKFDGTTFAIAFSLAHIPLFAGIAVAVVIGVYCCYKCKRKGKTDLTAIAEKGGLVILDDQLLRAKEEGRLMVNVSILENGKPAKPNDYSKQKNGSVTTVDNQPSPDKKSHVKDQSLPPVPDAVNPIPLTEDGYSTLEQSESDNDNDVTKLGETSSDGYTLLAKEGEPDDTGYDEVNDQDTANSQYEMGNDLLGGGKKEDEHDYEEPYWEPASKEEELMDQLSKLNVPVIPIKNIEIKRYLGSGQFGTVYGGMWKKSESDYEVDDVQEVAVKSMREGAGEEERTKFLQEAAIMGQFKHSYILQILGYMTGDPLKIVVEIMQKGDLRQHLISLRPDINQPVCKDLGAILLSYTRQIALGMGYLSTKQYVHRDLAARNVLVSEEGVCKIADFGLSRDLQHEDYYISQGGKIPVKWTAPEALHYRKYSTASDVWSYGCLLYEIWSLGYKPFHDLTNAEAMPKVASGYRLPPPPGCPRSIYQLMIKCWHPTPSSRPIFCETVVTLQHPDFQILKWTEKDLTNIASENTKILGSPLEEGHCLYPDLQNTYKTTLSGKNDTDQPQK